MGAAFRITGNGFTWSDVSDGSIVDTSSGVFPDEPFYSDPGGYVNAVEQYDGGAIVAKWFFDGDQETAKSVIYKIPMHSSECTELASLGATNLDRLACSPNGEFVAAAYDHTYETSVSILVMGDQIVHSGTRTPGDGEGSFRLVDAVGNDGVVLSFQKQEGNTQVVGARAYHYLAATLPVYDPIMAIHSFVFSNRGCFGVSSAESGAVQALYNPVTGLFETTHWTGAQLSAIAGVSLGCVDFCAIGSTPPVWLCNDWGGASYMFAPQAPAPTVRLAQVQSFNSGEVRFRKTYGTGQVWSMGGTHVTTDYGASAFPMPDNMSSLLFWDQSTTPPAQPAFWHMFNKTSERAQ